MSGHIVERGPNRWAIVLETRNANGKRKQKWHTFKGTKREAQKRLAELVTEREHGTYVEPSKQPVAQYFETWLRDWAPARCGPKTLERYQELAKHVIAAIGDKPMQQVRGGDLNRCYRDLDLSGKLRPRTIRHVHILATTVFRHAVKHGEVKIDPTLHVDPPKVPHQEAPVLRAEEIPTMLEGLRGTVLHAVAVVGLGTGLRRGELCALRWQDIDLEGGKLEVRQSLEQTKRGGLRFKEPKTKRGRRTVSLSPSVVGCLQEHRKQQLELRMKLGLGRPSPDALVFTTLEGRARHPDDLGKMFSTAMTKLGLPHVSLHTLRHTHASMLIKAGEDILTISRRLGHASAAITLNVYGHLMSSHDRAAEIIEKVLR